MNQLKENILPPPKKANPELSKFSNDSLTWVEAINLSISRKVEGSAWIRRVFNLMLESSLRNKLKINVIGHNKF
jgi:hypothetical protein